MKIAVFLFGLSFVTFVMPDGLSFANERVSVSSTGEEGDAHSATDYTGLSGNGRYAVFASSASNLVPNDTEGKIDIFLRDRVEGTTIRISESPTGEGANNNCANPSISDDGRYVVYETQASNLLPAGPGEDGNLQPDIFRYDTVTDTTIIASRNNAGAQGNGESIHGSISGDGMHVVFTTASTNFAQGAGVYVRDFSNEVPVTEKVSVISGEADPSASGGRHARISYDGQFVVFSSTSTNLIGLGNDTNGQEDIFVRDRVEKTTGRVSILTNGAESNGASQRPGISDDGNVVVFETLATNFGNSDTNGLLDVIMHNRQTGTTTLVSATSSGDASNGESRNARVSSSGQSIVYSTTATDIVPETPDNFSRDIYVFDTRARITVPVSLAFDGGPANSASDYPSFSGNELEIHFHSAATNLLPPGEDFNFLDDNFVLDNPLRVVVIANPGLRLSVNRKNADTGRTATTLKVKGRGKTNGYLFARNTGDVPLSILLRSNKPKSKNYRYKLFRFTGGRTNIAAAARTAGAPFPDTPAGNTVVCQARLKGKNRKGKHTLRYSLSSIDAPVAASGAKFKIKTK